MATPGDLPAPEQGLLLTHFLTVRDVALSRRFYAEIFGGDIVLEENPAIVKVANSTLRTKTGQFCTCRGRSNSHQSHKITATTL